jgi:hypothetical protein
MSVKALDAATRPAHSAGRNRANVSGGHQAVPFRRVSHVCVSNFGRGHCRLCETDPTAGFQLADGFSQCDINQPIPGRHGLSVVEEWLVLDHRRRPVSAPHNDQVGSLGLAAKLLADSLVVE